MSEPTVCVCVLCFVFVCLRLFRDSERGRVRTHTHTEWLNYDNFRSNKQSSNIRSSCSSSGGNGRQLPNYLEPIAVCEELRPWCRKSSSISKTFANSDFDERSFNSNSFIRFDIKIDFLVILRPGRDIRNIQGNHCRNTARICFVDEWMNNNDE